MRVWHDSGSSRIRQGVFGIGAIRAPRYSRYRPLYGFVKLSVPAERQLVVEVTCSSIVRSTAFYRTLGFQLRRAESSFVELAWDNCLLFMEEQPEYVPPVLPAANVRIMVDNVDEVWDRCVGLGVPVLHPIENRYYGLRDFTIVDPDNFGLRFATYLPGATGPPVL
jgi:hypothetical protein